jgi:ectoine hydroxylase-related dioxygenase (phytanoyl-CoA dioxygenase family)
VHSVTQSKNIFDTQGYLILRDFFSACDIENLSHTVDRIHRQWLSENRATHIDGRAVNMHSLTSRRYFMSDETGRLRFFERLAPATLTTFIDRMFGDDVYFHNTQLFFNPYDKSRLPYWHRDLQTSPVADLDQASEQQRLVSLHIRIPLVAEKGLELIPGSHRRWDTETEKNVRFERHGHASSDDLPGALLVELEPGDVLVFDAQMIHRGNYRLNRLRQALDLCIGKPHPYTSAYLDESVLPDACALSQIANANWYRRARKLACIQGE